MQNAPNFQGIQHPGSPVSCRFWQPWLTIFSLLLPLVTGCGPALSKTDLGTVVFEVPKVEGADKPYLMPELGPPLDKDPPIPHRMPGEPPKRSSGQGT
jgi:hypothetical protein